MQNFTTEKGTEKENLLNAQFELGQTLKDKGYITSMELYNDPHAFYECTNFKTPVEASPFVEALMMILMSPILHDDIEELVTNDKRTQYRKEIYKMDKDLYAFYESNKLQSSNIANVLTCVHAIHHYEPLSGDVMDTWETLRKKMSGSDDKYRTDAFRYKGELCNKEKYQCVKLAESLIELVLKELIVR